MFCWVLNTPLDFMTIYFFNRLIAKFTKWSNTLKQFVLNLSTNCLSVFDHFVGLALKGLRDQKHLSLFQMLPKHFVALRHSGKPYIIQSF